MTLQVGNQRGDVSIFVVKISLKSALIQKICKIIFLNYYIYAYFLIRLRSLAVERLPNAREVASSSPRQTTFQKRKKMPEKFKIAAREFKKCKKIYIFIDFLNGV